MPGSAVRLDVAVASVFTLLLAVEVHNNPTPLAIPVAVPNTVAHFPTFEIVLFFIPMILAAVHAVEISVHTPEIAAHIGIHPNPPQ